MFDYPVSQRSKALRDLIVGVCHQRQRISSDRWDHSSRTADAWLKVEDGAELFEVQWHKLSDESLRVLRI